MELFYISSLKQLSQEEVCVYKKKYIEREHEQWESHLLFIMCLVHIA